MERFIGDLRQAFRTLSRRPALVAVAVLTLALGVGGNTAAYSLIDSVLLEPLPYPKPDRLVRVIRSHPTATFKQFSYPDLTDLREWSTLLEDVGGYSLTWLTLLGGDQPVLIRSARVTEGFFSTLGVVAEWGRLFFHSDYVESGEKVVVLSQGTWRETFGGDPEVIGRSLRLNEEMHTVIGILPTNDLSYPDPDVELWVPALPDDSRGSRWLSVIGRLGDGTTLEGAQAEADAIAAQLAAVLPESNAERGIRLERLRESIVGDVRLLLVILLSTVGVILAIGCANLANLLLSRAVSRRREIAIRQALGAGRRIFSQLLGESLLLGLAGGAAGVLLAAWMLDAFLALSPVQVPRRGEIGMDMGVLLFAIIVSLITGMAAGVLPAIRSSQPAPMSMLRGSGADAGSGRGVARMRGALATGQIALSLVLLIGAGLLIKSFWRIQSIDPGFETERTISLTLSLPSSRYQTREAMRGFYDRLSERLAVLPGVAEVATVNMVPFSGDFWCSTLAADGYVPGEECVEVRVVSPTYFRLMRIPLLGGEAPEASVTNEETGQVVVSEGLARMVWGFDDVLGKQVTMFGRRWGVVGVVSDVRHRSLDRDPTPTLYFPASQAVQPYMNFVLKMGAERLGLMADVRREVWALDPELPILGLSYLGELVADSVAEPRFRALLMLTLAIIALSLAVVGVYGVLSYAVNQRTREIGIRIALGARPVDVAKEVLVDATRIALLGLAIGGIAAFGVTRVFARFLFEVSATDVTVFLGVALSMLAVAVGASYVPARRATRVDPIRTLRQE